MSDNKEEDCKPTNNNVNSQNTSNQDIVNTNSKNDLINQASQQLINQYNLNKLKNPTYWQKRKKYYRLFVDNVGIVYLDKVALYCFIKSSVDDYGNTTSAEETFKNFTMHYCSNFDILTLDKNLSENYASNYNNVQQAHFGYLFPDVDDSNLERYINIVSFKYNIRPDRWIVGEMLDRSYLDRKRLHYSIFERIKLDYIPLPDDLNHYVYHKEWVKKKPKKSKLKSKEIKNFNHGDDKSNIEVANIVDKKIENAASQNHINNEVVDANNLVNKEVSKDLITNNTKENVEKVVFEAKTETIHYELTQVTLGKLFQDVDKVINSYYFGLMCIAQSDNNNTQKSNSK